VKNFRLPLLFLATSFALAASAHAQAFQTISQTISDTAGDTVNLNYYLNSDGDTPNFFGVTIGAATVFSQSNIAFQNYTEYTFSFTASGSDTIGFEESNPFGFLGLDSISVADTTDSTNTPSLINGGFQTGDFTGWTLSDPDDPNSGVVNVAYSDTETLYPNGGQYFAALGYAPEPAPVLLTSSTPEPSSLILLGTGILSMAGAAFRKRR